MLSFIHLCTDMGRTIGQKMLPQYMEEIIKLPITEVLNLHFTIVTTNNFYYSLIVSQVFSSFSFAFLADITITVFYKLADARPDSSCQSSEKDTSHG